MAEMTKIEPFVISRVFDAPRDRVWQAWNWTGTMDQFTAYLAKG